MSSPEPKMPPPPARRTAPPPAPAPRPAAAPAPPVVDTTGRFAVTRGRLARGQKVMIYGPGGIGKTTLAALAPEPIFLDIESSTGFLDVARIEDIEDWMQLRTVLQSKALDEYRTIVIDSVTKAEEMAVAHTLATVKHEKGHLVTSIEGYGFGKGYQHVYETFVPLLVDIDKHTRAGRNVILIAHDCVNDVPNPVGDDFIRFEPRLQQPKSGKASIRERVFEEMDHVFWIGYDVDSQDGKGKGGGTRSIWPVERPDHRAKSRSLADRLDFESAEDGVIWEMVFGGGGAQ